MMKRSYFWLGLGACIIATGCDKHAQKASVEPAQSETIRTPATPSAPKQVSPYATSDQFPHVREPHVRKGSEVTELLTDATSAFRASLAVDDYAVYLLTDEVAYRIVPGSAPERTAVSRGVTGAVTRTDYIYWTKGAIWRASKAGGKGVRLATLTLEPQYFFAAGNDFAWLSMQERERFVIQTLEGKKVRTLISYDGRIETAAMGQEGRIYFVARSEAASWRIGSVSIHGGEPSYTTPKAGQTPAKLAVDHDVYYYDVKSNELRELSSTLDKEQALTHDFICSPLAVNVRIYCPNMDGMFELARHRGAKPMPLFPSRDRIAAVAASSKFLVWLSDAGPDRLSLKMIRLELDDSE